MKFILGFVCGIRNTRLVLAVALMATAFVVSPFPSAAQPANRAGGLPVIILVRHADKAAEPADDPPLTAAGTKRAQDLAAALGNAGVTAIITTQVRRTRETAQPLAKALGLVPQVVTVGQRALVPNPPAQAQMPPEVVKARDEYVKLLKAAMRRLGGGVVLVVGHDWSVPGLIGALGGPPLPNICSSVYDNLFILTVAGGKAHLIQAHYGAATPDTGCK